MIRPAVALPESHVETACPLDCPDACSLRVTLRGGRITRIDGSGTNDVTRGYICAKVRQFHHRVYGDDRLLHPALAEGPQRLGRRPPRHLGCSARPDRHEDCTRSASQFGAEAILPLSYGGSNGLLTQDTTDAMLLPPARRVASAAHGVRRADRRRQSGPLRQDAVGQLPGLSRGAADRRVGREPGDIRHPPDAVPEGGPRARREARRHRSARDDAGAAGRPVPAAAAGHGSRRRARHPSIPVRRRARGRGVSRRPHDRRRPTAREGGAWTFERAAEVSGVPVEYSEHLRGAVRALLSRAGQVRLGPRAQSQRRQRRGGDSGAARRRRQVRRPRRRLLDEQLRVVEHRAHVAARSGAADARDQHESPRAACSTGETRAKARRSSCSSSTTAIPR